MEERIDFVIWCIHNFTYVYTQKKKGKRRENRMEQNIIKSNKEEWIANNTTNLSKIREAKENKIFDAMKNFSLEWAFNHYLNTLHSINTKKSYKIAFYKLYDLKIIDITQDLQYYSLINLNNILDEIKQVKQWSQATRQARAAMFIAFTKFIERKTESIIKRATPEKTGTNKTFHKIRSKVKTETITIAQAKKFIRRLRERNLRDCLIAQLCLQGAKRINEVLDAKIQNINWEKRTIEFSQSKVTTDHTTIISFPEKTMHDLSEYLEDRKEGHIFITTNGECVHRTQINRSFAEVSRKTLGKKISPHTLRATAITEYKKAGFNYEDIQKISGHKTLSQLGEYDKTEKEDNPSKEISLI